MIIGSANIAARIASTSATASSTIVMTELCAGITAASTPIEQMNIITNTPSLYTRKDTTASNIAQTNITATDAIPSIPANAQIPAPTPAPIRNPRNAATTFTSFKPKNPIKIPIAITAANTPTLSFPARNTEVGPSMEPIALMLFTNVVSFILLSPLRVNYFLPSHSSLLYQYLKHT